MTRILFPLFMALMAFFGPWKDTPNGQTHGFDLADNTVGCFIELEPSFTGDCAPLGTLAERLVTYTVIGGSFAAVLSIFGLLPIVSRITSLAVLAAGGVGLAASLLSATDALSTDTLNFVGWGAWGTLALALITVISALSGFRGNPDRS